MKGFGFIGLIIAVAIVAFVGGGGYYYVQKTSTDRTQINNFSDIIDKAEEAVGLIESNQQDTGGEAIVDTKYKTYKNEILGYSFMYPSSFTLSPSGPDESYVKIIYNGTDSLNISIVDSKPVAGVDVYSKVDDRYSSNDYSDTQIGDKMLRVQRNIPGVSVGDEYIWKPDDSRYIIFVHRSNTEKIEEYLKIIESFKIIN